MKLTTYHKNIIFQFVDTVNAKGQFEKQRTDSGIYLQASFDDSAKEPRWVNVIAVGSECTIKPGQQVLLPNLRWTSGFKYNGQTFWRSDEVQAAAVRNTPQSTIQALSTYVIFSHRKPATIGYTGGLVVVGGHTETSSGVVVVLGPDTAPDLKGTTFWYDNTNFTDDFTHGGFKLAFIKDENILAYKPLIGE